jgi:hypothetical protein
VLLHLLHPLGCLLRLVLSLNAQVLHMAEWAAGLGIIHERLRLSQQQHLQGPTAANVPCT